MAPQRPNVDAGGNDTEQVDELIPRPEIMPVHELTEGTYFTTSGYHEWHVTSWFGVYLHIAVLMDLLVVIAKSLP